MNFSQADQTYTPYRDLLTLLIHSWPARRKSEISKGPERFRRSGTWLELRGHLRHQTGQTQFNFGPFLLQKLNFKYFR